MSLRGIEFHTEESPQAILKSTDGSLSVKTNKGTVDGFSHVMFATGRRPNTKVWNSFSNGRIYFIAGIIGSIRLLTMPYCECENMHIPLLSRKK